MYTCPIELKDVRYNAGNQCFEAIVTLHDNATVRRYACAFEAPITLAFEDATKGLARQAIRRHQQKDGLFSEFSEMVRETPRRLTRWSTRRWLNGLISAPERKAA